MSPFFYNQKNRPGEEDPALTGTSLTGKTPKPDPVSLDETEVPQEEEIAIQVPPVEEPFYGLDHKIAYFGFSQQGQSHVNTGMPCQDRCCHAFIPDKGILITAAADGVGSCALSDLGAHTAVHASVDHIKGKLQAADSGKLDTAVAGELLRDAMQYAYDQVSHTAEKHQQLLYSLQSTLTVAIYDGVNLYFGHAGDDGIVALTEQRTLAMATSRHKGEEASSVYPLQSATTWQFGMVPNTAAFVLATDGVLDAFVRSSFEKNRVYYPFLEPIFTARYTTRDSVGEVCKEIYDFMRGKKYRKAVTDDLTLVAVMNLEKLPRSLPDFDLDAWNEETRQYEERVKQALYGKKDEPAREGKGDPKQDGAAADARDTDRERTGKPDAAASRNPRQAKPGNPDRNRPPRAADPRAGGKTADRPRKTVEYDEDGYYSPHDEYDRRNRGASGSEGAWDDWPPRDYGKRKSGRKNSLSEAYWNGFMTGMSVAVMAYVGYRILKLLLSASWLFI